jgi:hypothetical protein
MIIGPTPSRSGALAMKEEIALLKSVQALLMNG